MSSQIDSQNHLNVVYAIFAMCGLGYLIYFFYGAELLSLLLILKTWQLRAMSLFTHHFDQELLYLQSVNINQLNYHLFKEILATVGRVYFYVLASVAVFGGYLCVKFHPTKKFTRKYNMQSLCQNMVDQYPAIAPAVKDDLLNQASNALKPEEYLLTHELNPLQSDFTMRTQKVLLAQIGERWRSFESLSFEYQALFCVFALHKTGKIKQALALCDETARFFYQAESKKKKLLQSQLNTHAKNLLTMDEIKTVCSVHFYVQGVLLSLLSDARKLGILASSSFLWLKAYDRTMWYTLNNLGRKSIFIEGAAGIAHWTREKELEMAIEQPLVGAVIDKLRNIEVD
ncbi:hypothetical protein [Cysteiniphilum sp. JM-1]|uniref:secretion/conjugation apparatus DotM-related subunit n=1 Tax=Cysteiniphilum sp. JM-1 TaxID=2610891 RepID=UPI0012457FE6|nr:hypothetical protein [Cysteiniphilum sp. JM-1]